MSDSEFASYPQTEHECPGQCGKRVPHERLACYPCWRHLPYRLRRPILQHWRRDPDAHALAVAAALAWYADNRAAR